MMQLHMLTTVDNPYSPETDFDKWQTYDHAKGYYTAEYLGRIALTGDGLSDTDQDLAIERAIDEIIKENVTGLYKKYPISDKS